MIQLFFALPIVLMAYMKDETISGYVDHSAVFQLTEINGAPFAAKATLTFHEKGKVAGTGPCNSYSANQSAPYPWFELGPLKSTRTTCPELPQESLFFETLQTMTLVETFNDLVILRNDAGDEMVFQTLWD